MGPEVTERADRDPEESLVDLMARVQHLLARRVDEALAEYGLTLRQFTILTYIEREPGIRSTELARRLFITRQAISMLVQRLLAAGLVVKAPSRSTQALVLSLSDAGRCVVQTAARQAAEAEAANLAALSPTEVAATRRALQTLLRALVRAGAHTDPHRPDDR